MRVHTKNWLGILLITIMLILSGGCEGLKKSGEAQNETAAEQSNSNSNTDENTVDLKLRLEIPLAKISKTTRSAARSVASAEVTSVKVDVKQGSTFRIQDQAFTKNGTVWEGTLSSLPIGFELTIIAKAYDVNNVLVFSGQTVKTLTGNTSSDAVSVTLSTADGTVTAKLPKIEQISRPPGVEENANGPVDFYVSGSFNDVLTWEIIGDDGTFTPANGTVTLTGTSATISTDFVAPLTSGTFNYTFKLTNSQGNSIKAVFSITIIGLTDSSVTLYFAPTVDSFEAERIADDVFFTVNAADDKPLNELTYAWTYDTGTSRFESATSNPVKFIGYLTSDAGQVQVTITDADGGQAILKYALVADMFPDAATLVVNTGEETVGQGGGPYTNEDWASMQTAIFSACHSCHGGASPTMGVDLEADMYATVVTNGQTAGNGVLLIAPGNPDGSYIVQKLKGAGADFAGSQMPMGGPYFDTATIARLEEWILAGAKFDPFPEPAGPTTTETWASIQQIFADNSCTGCHAGGSPNGLNWAADQYTVLVTDAKVSTVGIPYIAASSVENSYVIQKLEGAGAQYAGSQMPLAGTPLDTATIDRIKEWIAAGAPEI